MTDECDNLALRTVEAFIFASHKPVSIGDIQAVISNGLDVEPIIQQLQLIYSGRGIELKAMDGSYCFVTALDIAPQLAQLKTEPRKLTRAALETLAVIAYHQPATRAEIEDIRGVSIGKGTLDILLETGFVRMRGRRRTLGRPITYGTTPQFLLHFGISSIQDMPGVDELKSLGLLQERLSSNFSIPNSANDTHELFPDEDAIEDNDLPRLVAEE